MEKRFFYSQSKQQRGFNRLTFETSFVNFFQRWRLSYLDVKRKKKKENGNIQLNQLLPDLNLH